MSHAERCPVCGGTGRVPFYPYHGFTSNNNLNNICHGCGGKGWVTVIDEPNLNIPETIQPVYEPEYN